MASGDAPSDVAFAIAVSLREHARRVGKGIAKADGAGYAVPELPSGRESFHPDASYCLGPRPDNRMKFIQGPLIGAETWQKPNRPSPGGAWQSRICSMRKP
jgi:hypothetical protein